LGRRVSVGPPSHWPPGESLSVPLVTGGIASHPRASKSLAFQQLRLARQTLADQLVTGRPARLAGHQFWAPNKTGRRVRQGGQQGWLASKAGRGAKVAASKTSLGY
jgi:hypothetical protein